MPNVFQQIRANRPGRSVQNLSHGRVFTTDMAKIVPVCCLEVIPGDKFHIGNRMVVRMNPMVTPLMHEIGVKTYYFYYPIRLLWENWENFITGGVDGDDVSVLPRMDSETTDLTPGELWDMLGFPLTWPAGANNKPLDFPRRAYYRMWNEYFRDNNLQEEIDITDNTNMQLMTASWEKDYFTSALIEQQRGTPTAIPLSGLGSAVWDADITSTLDVMDDNNALNNISVVNRSSGSYLFDLQTSAQLGITGNQRPFATITKEALNDNSFDFADAVTFTPNDLRLAFQLQKWQERNNRGGVRYVEWLQAHWGVHPDDRRLQRGLFIGGSSSPITISEVLQTSETTSGHPQGNMSGHGINVNQEFCGSFFAEEYGVLLGVMVIRPKPMYHQGFNRQWLRRSRYDFPHPEFVGISEQGIENMEIMASASDAAQNNQVWGFQGRYDELRYVPSTVHGLMHPGVQGSLASWNLCRHFDPQGAVPGLNEDFIKCDADTDRIFAVPSQPGFIVSYGNLIKAIRPIPSIAEPGLIDHN